MLKQSFLWNQFTSYSRSGAGRFKLCLGGSRLGPCKYSVRMDDEWSVVCCSAQLAVEEDTSRGWWSARTGQE